MKELTTASFSISSPLAVAVALFSISGYTFAYSRILSKDKVNPSATVFCKLARLAYELATESIVAATLAKLLSAFVYALKSPVMLPYKLLYMASLPWLSWIF